MDTENKKGVDGMDVNTIRTQIKQKQVDNFYIFTGPEWQGQKIYMNQLSKVTGNAIYRIESITEVYGKLRNKSFSSNNYIYVARDDKEFMQNEKLQDQLKSIIGNNMYILLLTSVDKRTKFYKKYKDNIVEFEYVKESALIKYIQKEIYLSESNCKKLIEVCESDYGRILLEIDKIKQFDKGDNCFNDYFQYLLKDGTIYKPPKDAIFDFVDAVLDRSIKCWDLLGQSYAVGEANMVLISVLYNNIKAVLQVQSCESKDVSKSTGLTGWQIMNAKKHLNQYSNGELVAGMKLLQGIESEIKTGKIEDEFSVQYFLCKFL